LVRAAGTLVLLAVAAMVPACRTSRVSDTSRTGLEQLLISNAVDQTLAKLEFPPVAGQKVYLEEKYLDCVDKGYVVASIRHRLMTDGARLVDAKDQSEVTIELRSGGVGTDSSKSFVGLPKVDLPMPLPLELPEVRMYERQSQFGTAKIGMVAYRTETGEMIFDSGGKLARADDQSWTVFGVGPLQRGSVSREIRQALKESRQDTAGTATEMANAPRTSETQRR
jgi:hypothetical protein